MHCDTLTVCADKVADVAVCGLQTSFENLRKSGCAAQCFAIFTEGENSAEKFETYLDYYKQMLDKHKDICAPITNSAQIERAEKEDRLGCILTVENLGFIGGDLDKLTCLKQEGVKMASLVWNYENALARPNLIFENGLPSFEKRDARGLTELGRQAVERLDELKIIIDISHLSDGGAEEILEGRKTPIVASHSNAQKVCNVSRNLSDKLIKKTADCGGVIGINFCADFLGGEAFESVYNHLTHLIKIGGEGVVALGSDFDGIPEVKNLEDCTRVPKLFDYLLSRGIKPRTLENFAFNNFLRVFKEFD